MPFQHLYKHFVFCRPRRINLCMWLFPQVVALYQWPFQYGISNDITRIPPTAAAGFNFLSFAHLRSLREMFLSIVVYLMFPAVCDDKMTVEKANGGAICLVEFARWCKISFLVFSIDISHLSKSSGINIQ